MGFALRAYSMTNAPLAERSFAALPIRVGRNALNDFQLNQDLVSNFHALVEELDGKICVRDLSSKNGVYVWRGDRVPTRIQANTPVDLSSSGFTFFLGPQLRLELMSVQGSVPESLRGSPVSGSVLGNEDMLRASRPPSPDQMGNPLGGLPSLPPLPPAGPGQDPAALPGAAAPYGALPPLPGQAPAGANWAAAPNAAAPLEAPGGRPGMHTGHFNTLPLDGLALQGLRELAGSLVPGKTLKTTGDVARFITKLHDAIAVFCRCFIPLREGHAQFISSLDLQRAAMQRSMRRSRAYMAVEMARQPEAVAAALLDWNEPSLDGPKAVEGIFADLMIHQVALLDGVMQGVQALLEELSPERIEQSLEGQGRFGLGGRNRALWQAYAERFAELSDEKHAFSRIFGSEFTEAYREYRRRRSDGTYDP
jgi:type VI secretion system protein ImpI